MLIIAYNYVTYTSVRSFVGLQQHKQAHTNSLRRDVKVSWLNAAVISSFPKLPKKYSHHRLMSTPFLPELSNVQSV